jgi:Tfp pilus assembly PilM family ATPase
MTRKYKDKKVDRVILVGGASILPGLSDYMASRLNVMTNVANPFSRIVYPPEIDSAIRETGPSYSVAAGLALSKLVG